MCLIKLKILKDENIENERKRIIGFKYFKKKGEKK